MNKIPSGLRPYKKGQTGNPGGQSKALKEIIPLVKESRVEFDKCIHLFGKKPVHELQSILDNNASESLQAVVAKLYLKTIEGSANHLSVLLDRLLGPISRHVDITASSNKEDMVAAFSGLADKEKMAQFVVNYQKRIEKVVETPPDKEKP